MVADRSQRLEVGRLLEAAPKAVPGTAHKLQCPTWVLVV
jgi:hypothetical protein